jgi:hypothetical protein
VGRHAATKMQVFEARHPGLCQKVDAMFEAFTPLRAVAAMIRTEYGERISHTSIWRYKRQSWDVRRDQIQEMNVVLTAFQELVSEERS